jgi:hypothetical protein
MSGLTRLWRENDRGQQVIDAAERDARLAQLCEQRDALFAERAAQPPEQQAALTTRLMEIGRELAELNTPSTPVAPLGEWINSEVSRGLIEPEPRRR